MTAPKYPIDARIVGYSNYCVYDYLNIYQERHRQRLLRKYLVRGAIYAAHEHLRDNPGATFPELKAIIRENMQFLRMVAESAPERGHGMFRWKRALLDQAPAKQQPALALVLEAYERNRRPNRTRIARKCGITRRTLYRWSAAWLEHDAIGPVLRDAVDGLTYRQVVGRVAGTAIDAFHKRSSEESRCLL